MVAPLVMAALISGGLATGGKVFDIMANRKAASRAAALNRAARQKANRLKDKGGTIGQIVRDAKKAGISPLAALGSSAAGAYSMAQSPMSTFIPGQSTVGSSVGEALGSAVSNVFSAKEQSLVNSLSVENMALKNAALRAEINKTNVEAASIEGLATSRTQIAKADQGPLGIGVSPVDLDRIYGGTSFVAAPKTRSSFKAGIEWLPAPFMGDMQDTTQRLGDEGPLVWLLQALTGAADVGYTSYARYRAMINQALAGKSWPGGSYRGVR